MRAVFLKLGAEIECGNFCPRESTDARARRSATRARPASAGRRNRRQPSGGGTGRLLRRHAAGCCGRRDRGLSRGRRGRRASTRTAEQSALDASCRRPPAPFPSRPPPHRWNGTSAAISATAAGSSTTSATSRRKSRLSAVSARLPTTARFGRRSSMILPCDFMPAERLVAVDLDPQRPAARRAFSSAIEARIRQLRVDQLNARARLLDERRELTTRALGPDDQPIRQRVGRRAALAIGGHQLAQAVDHRRVVA